MGTPLPIPGNGLSIDSRRLCRTAIPLRTKNGVQLPSSSHSFSIISNGLLSFIDAARRGLAGIQEASTIVKDLLAGGHARKPARAGPAAPRARIARPARRQRPTRLSSFRLTSASFGQIDFGKIWSTIARKTRGEKLITKMMFQLLFCMFFIGL